jgi:hypothetical protein
VTLLAAGEVSTLISSTAPMAVPVDPDAPEAQRWLIAELSKSAYQAAKPSLFDQLAKQLNDWITSLITGLGSVQIPGAGSLLTLVIVIAVAVLLVIVFLVFGVPRLNRRSTAVAELFGDDDARTSAILRRDAERAAADGDLTLAVAELFRAVARGLDERTLVSAYPGSTARDVAERAGLVFPDAAPRLLDAAHAFDGVRYLGAEGTPSQWQALVALDRELRTSKPTREGLDETAEWPLASGVPS